MARKPGKSADDAVNDPADDSASEPHGVSPNLKTNLVLADIALRGGGMLLRRSVERGVLGMKTSPRKARDILKRRTMAETLIGTALARVATRSVPGAIIVGGGMLAKTLYDRRKRLETTPEDSEQPEDVADTDRKP